MTTKTGIAWTDATWNPVTGCSRVSEGCRHCYAEELSLRYRWSAKPWTAGNAVENVRLHPERLDQPLHWRQPRRVFTNSMSDLFHEQVPESFILQVFAIMCAARHHTYQVLTKRPERMAEMLRRWADHDWEPLQFACDELAGEKGWCHADPTAWPPPNIWLGVSVENQRAAVERIPLLWKTPAAVRFLSCEPLLEALDIRGGLHYIACPQHPGEVAAGWGHLECDCRPYQRENGDGIEWIIVGGESGPQRRPMEIAWALDLKAQAAAAGVAFFFKQDSSRLPGQRPYLVEADGSCWTWRQFPGQLEPPTRATPSASDPRPRQAALQHRDAQRGQSALSLPTPAGTSSSAEATSYAEASQTGDVGGMLRAFRAGLSSSDEA